MSFGFSNTEGVKPHTGNRSVPDDGDYHVMISKSVLEPSKKGKGGENIVLEYTILAGTFAGAVVKEWLSVINASDTAQNIARAKAEALRVICKLSSTQGSDDLLGKELIIRSKKEPNEYVDNTGTKRTGYNATVVNYMTTDRRDAEGKEVPAFIAVVKQEPAQARSVTHSSSGQQPPNDDMDDDIPF